jgi:hypothetical protein
MKNYRREENGQDKFFEDLRLDKEVEIKHNSDGYYKGIFFEFKKHISDINSVLFQAIKYLSNFRLNGISIPKNIILVSLSDEKIYRFQSLDFIQNIETIYTGASSKNVAFTNSIKPEEILYSTRKGIVEIINIIDNDEGYTKINIDKYCVAGWADRFYREDASRTKKEFFEELKNPKVFKDFINPWNGEEDDFKYVMDLLNDKKQQKTLGAFYTPPGYAEKALELVRDSIKEIKEANPDADYVIIDRCAGTGVLEENMTEEELKHVIINTYELKEWVVLNNRFGDKVRAMLPKNLTENPDGTLKYGDALDVDVFEEIKEYVDDPNCNIVVFENPPYKDVSTGNTQKSATGGKISFVKSQMVGNKANELSNQFIFSAWEYYLKKENDFLVVFSPVKYWKLYDISDMEFKNGFIFNRKHFHATDAAISCIQWKKSLKPITSDFELGVFDIDSNNSLVDMNKKMKMKKCKNNFSGVLFTSNKEANDQEINEFCGFDGLLTTSKPSTKSYINDNILAYMRVHGFMNNGNSSVLNRLTNYNAHGSYLRKRDFEKKLPLFVAKTFRGDEWFEKEFYMSTSDNSYKKNKILITPFEQDNTFLRRCLLFSCLTNMSKMRTLDVNGTIYRNELCFDTTLGETEASKKLNEFREIVFNETYSEIINSLSGELLDKFKLTVYDKILPLEEQNLLNIFQDVLNEAKKTKGFNPKFTYGVFQIESELNTSTMSLDKKIFDYPYLNTRLNDLKRELKIFYDSHILPDLFKYELLK